MLNFMSVVYLTQCLPEDKGTEVPVWYRRTCVNGNSIIDKTKCLNDKW